MCSHDRFVDAQSLLWHSGLTHARSHSFFIETFRFQGLASSIYSRTKGLPLDERSEMIALICEADAKQTFQVHKAHFGEPPFIIQQLGGLKKTGCLSVLIAGLIGTSIPLGLVLYEALGWS